MLAEIINKLKPFKDNDATQYYLDIVSKPCDGEGEYHHILPRSLFPQYAKESWNIIKLSYKDHYKVHCLLPDMLEGSARASMLYAWNMMSGRHADQIDPAESYERFRTELNEIIRESNTGRKWSEDQVEAKRKAMQGKNNHQYGKKAEQSVWYGKVGPNKDREWSDDTRKLWSKQRSGEGNGMFGRKHTEETKKKIGEKLSGEGNGHYGKTTSDKQKAAASETCRNRKWTEEERRNVAKKRMQVVIYEGQIYESQTNLAKFLGVTKSTIGHMIKRNQVKKLDKPENPAKLQETEGV